jgi:hypothetical protein
MNGTDKRHKIGTAGVKHKARAKGRQAIPRFGPVEPVSIT